MRRLIVASVMLATGCPSDPPPAGDGSTGSSGNETVEPGTMSTSSASTSSTGPTTEPETGSSTAVESTDTSSGSESSGSTGEVCVPIPEVDEMPPDCPGDQALAGPPITCLVGDTLAPGDDVSSCAAVPIPGSGYGFIANAPGVWVFTVLALGLDPDPLIVVFDDENNELACSTDLGSQTTPAHQAAAVAVELGAAQSVRIVVQPEVVPPAVLPLVLRVAQQLNCSGDCCEADRGRMGCEYEHYADCTCMADDACCSDAWSEDCVALATGLCLAGCGAFP